MYVLLLFSLNSSPIEITDNVDLIELNHFYDGKSGNANLHQLIFYMFTKNEELEFSDYKPIFWIRIKDGEIPTTKKEREKLWKEKLHFDDKKWYGSILAPTYNKSKKKWIVSFHKNGIPRKVESKVFRETWTPFDAELVDAKYWKLDRSKYSLTPRRKL